MSRLAKVNDWLSQPDERKPRTRRKAIVLALINSSLAEARTRQINRRFTAIEDRLDALEGKKKPSEARAELRNALVELQKVLREQQEKAAAKTKTDEANVDTPSSKSDSPYGAPKFARSLVDGLADVDTQPESVRVRSAFDLNDKG